MAFRSIFTAATTRRNFIPLSITRIRPLVPAATIRALACYRTSAKKSVDAENEEVKQILDKWGEEHETRLRLLSELDQQQKLFGTRLKNMEGQVGQVQERVLDAEETFQKRLDDHNESVLFFRKILEEYRDMSVDQCIRNNDLHKKQQEFAQELAGHSADRDECRDTVKRCVQDISVLQKDQEDLHATLRQQHCDHSAHINGLKNKLSREKEVRQDQYNEHALLIETNLDKHDKAVDKILTYVEDHKASHEQKLEDLQDTQSSLKEEVEGFDESVSLLNTKLRELEKLVEESTTGKESSSYSELCSQVIEVQKQLGCFEVVVRKHGEEYKGRFNNHSKLLGGCEIDIKVIQGDLKKLQSLVNAHNSLVLDQGDKLKDLALARFGEIQVGKDSLIERKDILQASKVCEENSHIGVDAAGSCHYLEIVYKMHDEKIMELEKNLNVLKRSRYSDPAECWQDQETRMEKLESWRDDASLAKLSELILRQEGQISEVKRLREEADKAPTMKELLKPQEAQLLENGSQLSELDNKVSGHKDEISELKKQVKGLQNQLKQAEETFKAQEHRHKKELKAQDLRYDYLLDLSARRHNTILQQLQVQSTEISALNDLHASDQLSKFNTLMSHIESIKKNQRAFEREKWAEQKQNIRQGETEEPRQGERKGRAKKIWLWAKRVKERYMPGATNVLFVIAGGLYGYLYTYNLYVRDAKRWNKANEEKK